MEYYTAVERIKILKIFALCSVTADARCNPVTARLVHDLLFLLVVQITVCVSLLFLYQFLRVLKCKVASCVVSLNEVPFVHVQFSNKLWLSQEMQTPSVFKLQPNAYKK